MPRLRILGGPGYYPGTIQLCRPPLPELPQLAEKLSSTLASGMLTKGEELAGFEADVAQLMGVKYAFGVSSCTMGLALSLASLKKIRYDAESDKQKKDMFRLGSRHKIAVPSFTFLASVTSSIWAGYDPVFIDADLRTYNLSITDLEKKLTDDISAIVFTHVFGSPTGIDQVQNIASKRNIPVVFDAAHGFGILHGGKPIGSEGMASSFSLTPTKLLTSGEGGFVTTNNEQMALNLRILREYGTKLGAHDTVYPGLNGRMSELHAILGRWGLTKLEDEATERNRRVKLYKDGLSQIQGLTYQIIADEDRCSYKDFGIRVDESRFGLSRDELLKVLSVENIQCKPYFYPAVHSHSYFKKPGEEQEDTCPNATRLSKEMLCPPLFGSMTDAQQKAVIGAIIEAQNKASEIKKMFDGKGTS